ncbi:hypothetical protein MLD38_011411 [Melastoma candidum]|uniref:Uncharacterized protein n=1 Tax=Melastoma candidum TaxID=119954 RepID=A0ACB9R300_9MYRT|nr:hypothetical protein MLD38_011411 [Melastoma candidum]
MFMLVVLAAALLVPVTCLDPKYASCSPRNCGHLSISYPFWVVEKAVDNSACGYRGFDMRCIDDQPIYRTSGADYMIKDISYEENSFRVVDLQVINSSCPKPTQNYYFDRSPVDFGPNHADLVLFYGCKRSSPLDNVTTLVKIPCGQNASYPSFVGLIANGSSPDWPNMTRCETSVEVPVELGESQVNSTVKDVDYAGLLRAGFTLKWTALYDCERCHRSGGRCGYDHEKLISVCFCPDRPHPLDCHDGTPIYISLHDIGIGGLAIVFCLLSLGICFRKLRAASPTSFSCSSDGEDRGVCFEVPIFTSRELEQATGHFSPSNILGDGGFGTVYYGKLQDGREVAVKRLFEHSIHRLKHFMNEVEILARLRHKNLVTLYGCTSSHSHELLLVYEYVPNGTVASHLFGEPSQVGCPLPWSIRMSIAIQTATALTFLHSSDIIHRDVKTNNILLDKNFGVKVADFGISRLFPNDVTHVSTAPQGTPGYVDPEYHQCYQLTEKSDVYSFGVVLVELISSKPAVDLSRDKHEINLANFAINRIQRHALDEVIDPALACQSEPETHRMTTSMAELAFRCLQLEKEMRPTMEEVLVELKAIANSGHTTNGDKLSSVYDDNGDVLPPSPSEHDNIRLLKKTHPLLSPVSVAQKWASISNSSASLPGDTADKVTQTS